MRKAVLADTSLLYCALDPSDDNHYRAQEGIERLNAEGIGIMVAYTPLCECYSLILHKLGIGTRLAEGRKRPCLPGEPTPADFEEAADLVAAHKGQALSMFDAVTASLSRWLGLPAWTYDHHFDDVRGEVWRDG